MNFLTIVFVVVVIAFHIPVGAEPLPSVIAAPKQYVVLVDVSASRKPEMIDDARSFLIQLVDRMSFGDQLVVLQVQQEGIKDHPPRWLVNFPLPRDPTFVSSLDRRRLIGAKNGIRSVVPAFFEIRTTEKIVHTDLFATLLIADEFTRDSAGRSTVLVLLSDMLQSSNTGVEMEHLARMPTPDWIKKRKGANLIPHLPGACVIAIGADVTSPEGATVRSFWLDYFHAAGADLLMGNYRSTPPSLGTGICKKD